MSFDLMFQQATDLYLAGANVQAEAICRQMLTFAPENPNVLNLLGLIAAQKNEHLAAVSYFYEALKKSTSPLPVYFNLAVSLTAAQKYKEALQAYQNALKLAPQTKEIYNNMGAVYEKIGDTKKAAEHYEKALQTDPAYVDAAVNLAVLKKDITTLLALSQQFKNSALPLYYLALFSFDEANFQKALDYALKADLLQEAYDIKNLTAQICLKLKKNDMAEKYFHQALILNPKSVDALINLAVLEKSENHFKKALDISPSSFEAHLSYADFLYAENRKIEALEEYHQAVLLKPDDPALSNNVALVLKDMQDYHGALDLFFNAFLKAPENINISINIAETLVLLFQKEPEEAIKIAKLWQKNAPENIFAEHTLNAFENKNPTNNTLYAEALFDTFAPLYEARMQQIEYNILNKIKELNIPVQGKILDLGCGTGSAAAELKTEGSSWTGVDISSNMLAVARQKNLYDVLIKDDVISFLRTNTSKYDFVLCLDVFPYIQNVEELIEKSFPFKLIFSIEKAPDSVQTFELSSFGRYRHHPEYIQNLLTKAGYKSVKTHNLSLRKENALNVEGVLFIASSDE